MCADGSGPGIVPQRRLPWSCRGPARPASPRPVSAWPVSNCAACRRPPSSRSTRSQVAAAAGEWVTSSAAGAARAHCLAQQREHRGGRLGIEVAGRLVGQQQGRRVHQRAGDRHALQLTPRQLAGQVIRAFAEADRL